jgi:multidrug resistance efflux pump
MATGGLVAEILVQEGQPVKSGEVILRLRNAQQRAAVAQAEAAVASATARLDALRAGSRAEEIAAAQANADAAKAALARLKEGARPEDIAAGRSALAAAQAGLNRLFDGPDKNIRIAAEADLANAEAVLKSAQAAYDQVASRPDVGMLPQSVQLEQATNSYNAARARFDALFAAPEANLVAQARAQVKEAQANLARLLKPVTPAELAEAEAGVRQAEAQLDLTIAGPRDEEIAAALAALDEAKAARDQAQAALDDTELRSPLTGTLAGIHVKTGEQVVPGTPVAEIADLSAWRVETDDLTELDIVHVQEGQAVSVTLDALPGVVMPGRVERIEPIGTEKLGDMTYTVIVALPRPDPRVRWNMTAVVNFPQD